MIQPNSAIRTLFALFSIPLTASIALGLNLHENPVVNLMIGIGGGIALTLLFFTLDSTFKRLPLKTTGLALLGLVVGYFASQALMFIYGPILSMLPMGVASFINLLSILLTSYTGMILAASFFQQTTSSLLPSQPEIKHSLKRDLVFDASVLLDARLIDLASSGIVDQRVILPTFIINEINLLADHGDENNRIKGKRAQELIKKLEALLNFEMEIRHVDYADLKDPSQKLIQLAKEQDAAILTADLNRILLPQSDEVRWININFLANALKPLTQNGEIISIKIQRYGKEPRQGVGYLEDGTMVVVNSGAEYIGETIQAQVLSVKHTSSGRMIFCNALEENMEPVLVADSERKRSFEY